MECSNILTMTRLILSIVLFFPAIIVSAQGSTIGTGDFLSSDFHKERRALLREKMPKNSVSVFFANPVRNRANDVSYFYHQDPNFYYLTGHKEPHAALFIFKDKQDIEGVSFDEILFVRGHDALKELYEGGRLGKEGAMNALQFEVSLEGESFDSFNIDFSSFDKVMFYDFENDVRNTDEVGDLYDLIASFKQKVNYGSNSLEISSEIKASNLDTEALDLIMHELRGVKTAEEIALIRKAVDISTLGQKEVMKAIEPGMSEMEIQGLHEFIFKKYQAEFEGYPSIVGAGNNGCVLHYIDNYKPKIEDGELVLMDLGAEYHGYTADVTRTIPVNGTFTKEQKLIYDLVYSAQEAGMKVCKAGSSKDKVYQATLDIVNEGLVKLGLYKSTNDEDVINPLTGRNRYYPHGCCHHIGLDVHDKGESELYEANMVITIEPGIYIPEGSPCDEKWWGIPVRIEDDYLITDLGCELLSDLAPRASDDIEKLMKETSLFNQLSLPVLD